MAVWWCGQANGPQAFELCWGGFASWFEQTTGVIRATETSLDLQVLQVGISSGKVYGLGIDAIAKQLGI